jgi:predicted DCC family thiol-disulfide oxidoreductase YuxK
MKLDRPVLLYDGDCRFCRFMARGIEALDRHHGFGFLPFDDELASNLLAPLPGDEWEHSMHLVFPDGSIVSAGDALAELSQVLPLGGVLTAAAHDHRRVRGAFHWGYGLVADRRGQLSSLVPDVRGPLRRPESSA